MKYANFVYETEAVIDGERVSALIRIPVIWESGNHFAGGGAWVQLGNPHIDLEGHDPDDHPDIVEQLEAIGWRCGELEADYYDDEPDPDRDCYTYN